MKTIGKKHIFGFVTVGERGQIVIPAEARKMFNIKPKDVLIICGDEDEGLAIPINEKVTDLFKNVLKGEDKNG